MSIVRARILLVDDEIPIQRLVRTTLGALNFEVMIAGTISSARSAQRKFETGSPFDLLLLDLALPDGDGIEFIKELRQTTSIPIIVLSGRADERGKVSALDAGADDFVTKPFGTDELIARIHVALRHHLILGGSPAMLEINSICIDLVRRQVFRGGESLKLSNLESELLFQLARHAGKVLTHNHLLREVWGSSGDRDLSRLRISVRQLRNKLEDDPAKPGLLITEPGIGYRLCVSQAGSAKDFRLPLLSRHLDTRWRCDDGAPLMEIPFPEPRIQGPSNRQFQDS